MFSPGLQQPRSYNYSLFYPFFLLLFEYIIVYTLSIGLVFKINDASQGLIPSTLATITAMCWVLASFLTNAYLLNDLRSFFGLFKKILETGFVFMAVMLITSWKLSIDTYRIQQITMMVLGTTVTIYSMRTFFLSIYLKFRMHSKNRRNVIIVGDTPKGKQLAGYFSGSNVSQRFLGYFADEGGKKENGYLGNLDNVEKYCLENKVHEIYFTLNPNSTYYQNLLEFADNNFIFLGLIPETWDFCQTRKYDTVLLDNNQIPVIVSRMNPLRLLVNRTIKRSFDILFSAISLILLSITLFPIIAILIKLDSPGPIFFMQLRPGKGNKLFWCYKFRTMVVNQNGEKQATKNDPRITKFGAFLRKTSMDELPQFFNVLKGDMSVVGPRPNLIIHLQEYPNNIKEYTLRHWILPGITGYAQINGYRGETKELEQMNKRIEYDLKYIEKWSLSLDIKIISKTIYKIFSDNEKAY